MQLRLGSESTECRVIRADSGCLEFHMPADTVLETPDNSCLPTEMVYGESVTKIRYGASLRAAEEYLFAFLGRAE
ncbi:hypothetical protein FOL47_009383 [Perkinsus chesapeaki]|uniref:Uncharacterized protein n=1 Tax=Perkinsus chesapeaki TaxID=330153 RepID=A0A7J6L8R0_PERCH|nr:hypothetical protein FOL47_009383 [Perkinsus chesapeaki]